MNTIETLDVRPFRHLVMTIGELPSSFVDSMSYYELLAWLCNYVENNVVSTINNNAAAIEEIQEWIETLDLQDEVDNKLDEMAENGQLAAIIAEYLNAKAIMAFGTVAEMKAADNLVNGALAETYGFHTAGDKGGAKYLIREVTNEDTVDEMTIIALADNSLVAELVIEPSMNVKQFGATGDGTTDETTVLQKALDSAKNIYFPAGTYMVNAATSIKPASNTVISMAETAIIKAIANSLDNYVVVKFDDVDNVMLTGGQIKGERSEHTGATGEWGHCISIVNGSTNITIKDIRLSDGWGDGIYVNNANTVRTENIIIDNVRRNGVSIIRATNFHSVNDTIKNTNGTAPEAGVDIEPNSADEELKNIVFDNLYTEGNTGSAFSVHLAYSTEDVSILVNNHEDKGSNVGLSISKHPSTTGMIKILNPTYVESVESGIRLRGCYDSDCKVIIDKPVILNANTSLSSSTVYGTPISMYIDTGDDDNPLGNVIIKEPYITNSYTSGSTAIYIKQDSGSANDSINNVQIINPIYTENKRLNIAASKLENFIFTDEYDAVSFSFSTTLSVNSNLFVSQLILNSNTSTNRTLTVTESNQVNKVLKFTNMSNYLCNIALQNQTCTQLGVTSGGTIRLAHYGDSITIKKTTATNWVVSEMNCTPVIP